MKTNRRNPKSPAPFTIGGKTAGARASTAVKKRIVPFIALLLIVALGTSCSRSARRDAIFEPPPGGSCVKPVEAVDLFEWGRFQEGIASWYGDDFHGRITASGEVYDMYDMTAAHLMLPLGTIVEVMNLSNGRSVRVRINDRGPYIKGRILDLSYAAAKELGMLGCGTTRVRIEIISDPSNRTKKGFPIECYYALQFGAFSGRHNADDMKRNLEGLFRTEDIRIVLDKIGESDIFRVRAGKFNEIDEARTQALSLRGMGFFPPCGNGVSVINIVLLNPVHTIDSPSYQIFILIGIRASLGRFVGFLYEFDVQSRLVIEGLIGKPASPVFE